MFCTNCGSKNNDEVKFCSQCGHILSADSEFVSSASVTETVNSGNSYSGYASKVKPPRSSHTVINVVKNLIMSPVFIASIVTFTLYLIFNLFNVLSLDAGDIFDTYLDFIEDELGAELPIPMDEFFGIFDGVLDAFKSMAIVGMIPSVLMCIGMWITFSTAMPRTDARMSTSGLTMIKVIQVITLVSLSILAALCVAVSVFALIEETVLGIVLLLVFALVFTPSILYYAKLIQTINRMKNTMLTGVADAGVSMYVAVLCFIFACFSLIFMVTNGFRSLLLAASQICFGVYLISYRNEMRELIWKNTNSGAASYQAAPDVAQVSSGM